jgi:hypothetical protein
MLLLKPVLLIARKGESSQPLEVSLVPTCNGRPQARINTVVVVELVVETTTSCDSVAFAKGVPVVDGRMDGVREGSARASSAFVFVTSGWRWCVTSVCGARGT